MNTNMFTGKAQAYAKARPSYPDAVRSYIETLIPTNAIFADIGAGTGKWTVLLADQHYPVYAVEPNHDMREQLAVTLAAYPNVKIIAGTAEATRLPDKSVDVITCAQALHWFEPAAFHAECRRICRPGGIVIAIYNDNDNPGSEGGNLHGAAIDRFFRDPLIREFPNPIHYTREAWLAYMTSHSHDPLPSDPGYNEHIAKMNDFFDRENRGGVLSQEAKTTVYSEAIGNGGFF